MMGKIMKAIFITYFAVCMCILFYLVLRAWAASSKLSKLLRFRYPDFCRKLETSNIFLAKCKFHHIGNPKKWYQKHGIDDPEVFELAQTAIRRGYLPILAMFICFIIGAIIMLIASYHGGMD